MVFRLCPTRDTTKEVDIELGQPRRDFINGFPSAAQFIAGDPDHSFSIYPAFHLLSSRNLLYLEAELHELQKIQDDMDIEDSRGDPNTLQCFRSWNYSVPARIYDRGRGWN